MNLKKRVKKEIHTVVTIIVLIVLLLLLFVGCNKDLQQSDRYETIVLHQYSDQQSMLIFDKQTGETFLYVTNSNRNEVYKLSTSEIIHPIDKKELDGNIKK